MRSPTPQQFERKAFPLFENDFGALIPQDCPTNALDDRLISRQVQQTGGVLIQAEYCDTIGQKRGQFLKACRPHVAETGIVGTTFRVVPVGNHHEIKTKLAQNFQPLLPMQVLPHFVDLVYREGEMAYGEGSSAGSYQTASIFDTCREDFRNGGLLPVPHGIGGAARTDQHEIGFSQLVKGLLGIVERERIL